MIVLTVLSYSGVPAEGLSARFDELGGSIGRADSNQLVLPDPERSISRLHAKVVFRGGQYAIVDNGSNPIGVNGTMVPSGREQIIQPGDQVQIGSYLLTVSQGTPAGPANPFADLFGDGAQGLAGPVAPPPPASAWASPPLVSGGSASRGYGADAGGMPPMRAGMPLPAAAPAWGAAPAPAPWPAPAAPPPVAARPDAGAAASLLADDWDFLTDPSRPGASGGGMAGGMAGGMGGLGGAGPAAASSGSSALGLSLGPGATDSLDDLFGLSKSTPTGDPLGAAPAQALLLQPNTSAHADPMQSLLRPGADAGASVADHGSELNTPMPLPRAVPAAPAPVATPAGLPSGAIFSWDDPPRDGRHVTLPGRPRAQPVEVTHPPPAPATPAPAGVAALDDPLFGALFDPPTNPVSSARPDPLVDPLADLLAGAPQFGSAPLPDPPPGQAASVPAAVAAPAMAWAPAAAASAPPVSPAESAGADALLQALRQGLDVPGLRIEALTPAMMLLIGQLLRESTRGAVELLVARAALKREMRAQLTMIVARENNPLKFSPSVEVALQHLLAPPAQGFMAAAPAVRDAFDDLRAHQLGVMAGMKAALEGVLQRFDPEQLEGKLSKRSAIDSLIPATRKARLWESFQQLFSQLSSEAQDDFDELFGKAFLRAYEAQLDRLQAEPGPR